MYNKLFSKILDSSIWLESTNTRIVWLTFLAAMDETGFVQFASVPNVALRARVPHTAAAEAITRLESPDPLSADPDNEGRRIEKVPGGWIVLNAEKYRELVTRAIQQAQTRARVAKHRAKKSGNAEVTQPTVTSNAPVTPSEAYADSKTETQHRKKEARGRNLHGPLSKGLRQGEKLESQEHREGERQRERISKGVEEGQSREEQGQEQEAPVDVVWVDLGESSEDSTGAGSQLRHLLSTGRADVPTSKTGSGSRPCNVESKGSALSKVQRGIGSIARQPRASKAVPAILVESELENFERFWDVYPRRQKKIDALSAWSQKRPDISKVLSALEWQRNQPQWKKDAGAFIPLPASWLRNERWEDEPFHLPNSTPPADDVDWFDECKRLHNGACGSRYIHGTMPRVQS